MKTIILIHRLHMNSLSFFFMKKEFEKNNEWDVDTFDYTSLSFDEKVLENLNDKIKLLPNDREIVIVAHSMGGLVTRLYLDKYKPKRNIKVVTLGTPHQGSFLAKKIAKNSILTKFLGDSVNTGLTNPIPEWDGSYPLISIAGIKDFGIIKLLAPQLKEDSDGTVFVKETVIPFAQHVKFEDTHHMQLIGSKKAINKIKQYI